MLKTFNILVVKKLYRNTVSSFLINIYITSDILQKREVCQSNTLSCYLFILIILPLICRINQGENIKGFFCLKNNKELKCLVYADDLLFLLRDNLLVS